MCLILFFINRGDFLVSSPINVCFLLWRRMIFCLTCTCLLLWTISIVESKTRRSSWSVCMVVCVCLCRNSYESFFIVFITSLSHEPIILFSSQPPFIWIPFVSRGLVLQSFLVCRHAQDGGSLQHHSQGVFVFWSHEFYYPILVFFAFHRHS